MKSFTHVVLCFLLLTVSRTSAQGTFAPLITKNTALFIHVDLRKADTDTIKQNWLNYSEKVIRSLRFNDDPVKSTLAAFNNDLERLDSRATGS